MDTGVAIAMFVAVQMLLIAQVCDSLCEHTCVDVAKVMPVSF